MESAAALASDLFISYSTWKWIEVHKSTSVLIYRYRFDRTFRATSLDTKSSGSNMTWVVPKWL